MSNTKIEIMDRGAQGVFVKVPFDLKDALKAEFNCRWNAADKTWRVTDSVTAVERWAAAQEAKAALAAAANPTPQALEAQQATADARKRIELAKASAIKAKKVSMQPVAVLLAEKVRALNEERENAAALFEVMASFVPVRSLKVLHAGLLLDAMAAGDAGEVMQARGEFIRAHERLASCGMELRAIARIAGGESPADVALADWYDVRLLGEEGGAQ